MKTLFVFVLIYINLPPLLGAASYTGFISTAFSSGLDLPGGDLYSINTTTPTACAESCDQEPLCMAWSWTSCGLTVNNCFLKNTSALARTNDVCYVSRVKLGEIGIDRVGGNLPGAPLLLPAGSTPVDCAIACANTSSCIAWAFDVCDNSSCYLKASRFPLVTNASVCRVSAVQGNIGFDRGANDIANVNLPPGSTATTCNRLCLSTPGCTGWSMVNPTQNGCEASNTCWMKGGAVGTAGLSASTCRVSSAWDLSYYVSPVFSLGVDLPNGDLHSLPTTTPMACAAACDGATLCVAWSWSSCDATPTCYLKSTIGTRTANACRTSSVKLGEIGVDRNGGDMPGMPLVLGSATPSACAVACANTTGCIAWSFDICGNSNCWLKSSTSPLPVIASTCSASGVQGNVGYDRPNADLGTSVNLPSNATATTCNKLCLATPNCAGWAFVNPQLNCEQANTCWLKTAGNVNNALAPQRCRTSSAWTLGVSINISPAFSAGVDMGGGDLFNRQLPDPLSCAALCDNTAACIAWVWNSCGVPTCYLKNVINNRGDNNCAVSSVKLGEQNVDRIGGDMPGMPITLAAGSTASACADQCARTTGCIAWSFDDCGQRNCWLKSGNRPLTTSINTCRTSGVQGTLGFDRSGQDIQGSPFALAPGSTATTCNKLCLNTTGCLGWAFVNPQSGCGSDNSCWLKGGAVSFFPTNAQRCRISSAWLLTSTLYTGFISPVFSAGIDLVAGDLYNVPAPDPSTCASACDGSAQCNAWAWSSCGGSPTCYLKSSFTGRVESVCVTSSVKLGEVGIDRVGGDMQGMPLMLPATATAATCAQACANTTGCVAWSLNTCDLPQCWLKSSSTPLPLVPNTCRTSGVQGDIGFDRIGSDLANTPVTLPFGATATTCNRLCLNTTGCAGWAYVNPQVGCEQTNICWLKGANNNGDPLSPRNCRISSAWDLSQTLIVSPAFSVGVDMNGGDLYQTGTSDAFSCAVLCDKNALCAGWVWATCGTPTCYLKSVIVSRSNCPCCISSVKLGEINVDRVGGDMLGMPIILNATATPVSCAVLCASTSGCIAWSYDDCTQNQPRCWLKSGNRPFPTTINQCRTSGVQGNIGVDRSGQDLPGSPFTLPLGSTATTCNKLCLNTTGCLGWAMVNPQSGCESTNLCWLKGGTVSQFPTNGQRCRVSSAWLLTATAYTGYISPVFSAGVDMAGGDLYNIPAFNPTQCAEECDKTTLCVAWAWSSCGSPTCYLKSSITGRNENICVTSSVKLGEVGIDRIGGDMNGMPLILPQNATAATCAVRCSNTTGCVAWGFNTCNQPQCWLKSSASPIPTANDACRTSGIQGDLGYDRIGSDIAGSPVTLGPAATATTCNRLCLNTSNCFGWAFVNPQADCEETNICWLKSGTNNGVPLSPRPCRTSSAWDLSKHISISPAFSTGVDMVGGDLFQQPMGDPLSCAQLCDNTQSCVGWVWGSCGVPTCYLKNVINTRSNCPCCVSSVKLGEINVDRVGGDMPGMPIILNATATPVSCAVLCASTSGCIVWSYDDCTQNQPRCWLKSGNRPFPTTINQCRTSGIQGNLGFDRSGSDIQGSPVALPGGATATTCNKLCLNTTGCLGWAMVNPQAGCETSNLCWLKGGNIAQFPTNGQRCRISSAWLLTAAAYTGYISPVFSAGVDLAGGDLYNVPAFNPTHCAEECDKTSICVAWAWSSCGGTPTCYLKSSITGRNENICVTSSVKLGEVGIDRIGGDMPGMPLILAPNSTAATCAVACSNTTGCVAWGFNTCDQPQCWLKSSSSPIPTAPNACRTSGVQGNLNFDRSGADLPGSPYTLSSAATATTCNRLCLNTTGCYGWAMVNPQAYCEDNNICWLKTGSGNGVPLAPNTCRVSSAWDLSSNIYISPLFSAGQDRVGGDLFQLPLGDPMSCAIQCDKTLSCVGWVWASCGTPTCYLKSSITGRSNCACCVSGLKLGEANIDRIGGDMPGMPIALAATATPITCADQCARTSGCIAWAYDECTQNQPRCWLKAGNRPFPVNPNTCRTSGIIGNIGVDRSGQDLPGSPFTLPFGATVSKCNEKCLNTTGCLGWAYVNPQAGCETNNLCWLKGGNVAQFPTNNQRCRVSSAWLLTATAYTGYISPVFSAGVDMAGGDLYNVPAYNPQHCAEECDKTSICVAWAWSSCGGTPTCYLKSSITGRLENICVTSSVKLGEVGIDRIGGDMPGMPLLLAPNSTASTCAVACSNTTGCVAWGFNICDQPQCWLKSSASPIPTGPNVCRVSGVQGDIGYDRPGADVPGSPYVLPPGATATTCNRLCLNTTSCYGWAMVNPQADCEETNICWLKTGRGSGIPLSKQNCRTSSAWDLSTSVYVSPAFSAGVDRIGGDLFQTPLGDPTECAKLCDRTTSCVGWVWASCGVPTCYLKNQITRRSDCACCVSSVKLGELNVDRIGGDMPGMPLYLNDTLSPPTATSCAVMCAKTAGCVAWSYDDCGQRNCWLKSLNRPFPTNPNTCRTSAVQGTLNTDRWGSDLPGSPFNLPLGSTATACNKLCLNTTDCLGWAFVNPQLGCGSDNLCWLKTGSIGESPYGQANCRISSAWLLQATSYTGYVSPIFSAGVDMFGGDLYSTTTSSPQACAELCDVVSVCVGWVWDYTSSGACYLKSSITGRSENTRLIASVRLGEDGIDRIGGDMDGMPVALPAGATPTTCAALCANTTGCIAWSFDTCDGTSCFLKASTNPLPTAYVSCRTSAVQGNVGFDRVGDDIQGSPVTLPLSATATTCNRLCLNSTDCAGWAFVAPQSGCETSNLCWLKTASASDNQLVPSNCRVSSAWDFSTRMYVSPAFSKGVDMWGGDLFQTPLPTPSACAKLCDNTAPCVAWVWGSCGTPTCYLKSSITNRSDCVCCVSSVKLGEIGVDRVGGDMPGMPIFIGPRATASACAIQCANTTGCVAWSFNACDGTSCYLKSSSRPIPTTHNRCSVSGVQGNLGLDRSGSDLPQSPVMLPYGSTTTQCNELCLTTPDCTGWSYVNPQAGCEQENFCWLKGGSIAQSPTTPATCRVSSAWDLNAPSTTGVSSTTGGPAPTGMCPIAAPLQYGSSCCKDLPSCLAGAAVDIGPNITLPTLPTLPPTGGIIPYRTTFSGTVTNVVSIFSSPSSPVVSWTTVATVSFPPGAFGAGKGHDVHGLTISSPSTQPPPQTSVTVITPVIELTLDSSTPSNFLPVTIAFSSSIVPVSAIANMTDLCLGYINSANVWVCQDRNLILVSDGGITGQTNHFTPFALINYPESAAIQNGGGSSSNNAGIYAGVFVPVGVVGVAVVGFFLVKRHNPNIFARRFNRHNDESSSGHHLENVPSSPTL